MHFYFKKSRFTIRCEIVLIFLRKYLTFCQSDNASFPYLVSTLHTQLHRRSLHGSTSSIFLLNGSEIKNARELIEPLLSEKVPDVKRNPKVKI